MRGSNWRNLAVPSRTRACQPADGARQRPDRLQLPAIRICDPAGARPRRRKTRRVEGGLLFSGAAHLVLLLGMAWGAVGASKQGGEIVHVIRMHAVAELAGPPLKIAEVDLPGPAAARSSGPLSAPPAATTRPQDPGPLPPEISLSTFASTSSGPVSELLALFGRDGHGLRSVPSQQGSEFFGIRATGSRFVFVVDSSNSMADGGKWQDATRELRKAVERLTPQQCFYVIFFDGKMHPMFDSRTPEPALLPATEENLERFRRWLATVELGPFTRPAASMQMALRLEPDAIYLLSDGVFNDPTAALLRANNRVRKDGRHVPRVIVHTIGFHTQEGQRVLQRIADENGGRYVFIPPMRPPHHVAPSL